MNAAADAVASVATGRPLSECSPTLATKGMRASTGNIVFPGKGIHIGIVAEEIITFVGVFLWSEPCHVVDHAEHRNIDFGVAEHGYTLARIGNGHFLGSGDHHGTGQRQSLNKSQMYVAGSGGMSMRK